MIKAEVSKKIQTKISEIMSPYPLDWEKPYKVPSCLSAKELGFVFTITNLNESKNKNWLVLQLTYQATSLKAIQEP